jgi:hypothetical protein
LTLGPIRKALFLAALTAPLMNCTPTVPASLSGYQIVTGPPTSVSPQGTVGVSASCPASKVVVGGGYDNAADTAAVARVSQPEVGGNVWKVKVKNETLVGFGSFAVTPFAICVNRPVDYAISPSLDDLQNQVIKTFSAPCPGPAQFVSGGGISMVDDSVRPFSQAVRTSPEHFEASAKNHLLLPGRSSFTTTAICADFTQLPQREIVQSPASSVSGWQMITLTASCPAGKSALSGTMMSPSNELVAVDSKPTGNGSGWMVSVHNADQGSPPKSAVLQIVCAKVSP